MNDSVSWQSLNSKRIIWCNAPSCPGCFVILTVGRYQFGLAPHMNGNRAQFEGKVAINGESFEAYITRVFLECCACVLSYASSLCVRNRWRVWPCRNETEWRMVWRTGNGGCAPSN